MKNLTAVIIFILMGLNTHVRGHALSLPITEVVSIEHAEFGELNQEEIIEYLSYLISNKELTEAATVTANDLIDLILLNDEMIIEVDLGRSPNLWARESTGTGGGH